MIIQDDHFQSLTLIDFFKDVRNGDLQINVGSSFRLVYCVLQELLMKSEIVQRIVNQYAS